MRSLIPLLIALLLTGCERPAPPPSPFHAIDVSWRYEEKPADFRLTEPSGKELKLSDFNDKVVVLFFGYTHCPEICPTTLADLAQAVRLLGEDANRVQVLFVTLDPERDTPQVLGKYVPFFHPSFLGLYGDAQATAKTANTFAINYEKHAEKNGYLLDHSDGTYLIGTGGKPVLLSPYNQPVEFIVQDIKLLLQKEN